MGDAMAFWEIWLGKGLKGNGGCAWAVYLALVAVNIVLAARALSHVVLGAVRAYDRPRTRDCQSSLDTSPAAFRSGTKPTRGAYKAESQIETYHWLNAKLQGTRRRNAVSQQEEDDAQHEAL
jgi:hypothetical protein